MQQRRELADMKAEKEKPTRNGSYTIPVQMY